MVSTMMTARKGAILGSAALALVLAIQAAPGHAQGTPGTESARRLGFDIPAQDLNAALLTFADKAGVQIFFDTGLVKGLRSAPVQGTLSPREALAQLLMGTGFTFRFGDAGRVSLEKLSAGDGVLQLDPVQVGASATMAETATSPVIGYVAKRSATGSKTDTPLVETAQSISVVTRDQMDQQGVQTLNDALRYTSGVIPETRGAVATRYDMLKIRGFDAYNYWDGLRMQKMNYVAPQLDSYLLERAEVLKGPSSVMYGQAPAGGMVNQISKAPSETRLNEAGVEWGSNNHWVGTYDMAGAANADKTVLYRITALGRTEEGQIRDTESDRVAVMPSLTLRDSDRTSLTLNALFQRDPHANTYAGVPSVGSVVGNPNGRVATDFNVGEPNVEEFDRIQMALGYQFRHDLSDATALRLNGRWFSTKLDYASVYGSTLQADQRTMTRAISISHDELDSWSFDNQLEHKLATGPVNHTLLGGLDHQTWSGFYQSGTGTGTTYVRSIDIFAPVYAGGVIRMPATTRKDVEGSQTGLYAQDEMAWGGWRLSAAGRMDWSRARLLENGRVTVQDDQAFTGRTSLLYAFENGVSPYVSYAESFVPQTGTDAQGKAFDPERGTQYEIGAKYQPPGSASLYTIALFDLVRENLTTTDPSSNATVQTGEARSRGLELEAKISASENWNLIASYTYLNTLYTKDKQYEGLHLSGVPRHMASLWSTYSFGAGLLHGLSLGGGLRYRSDTFNSNATVKVQDYALADAMLSYDLGAASDQWDGATIALNVKNLFDREHVASCYTNTGCAYGYGRTITASLRLRW